MGVGVKLPWCFISRVTSWYPNCTRCIAHSSHIFLFDPKPWSRTSDLQQDSIGDEIDPNNELPSLSLKDIAFRKHSFFAALTVSKKSKIEDMIMILVLWK